MGFQSHLIDLTHTKSSPTGPAEQEEGGSLFRNERQHNSKSQHVCTWETDGYGG